jgi:hypothetical protein
MFVFDDPKRIFVTWAKLKEYYDKVIAANSNLKATYPDTVLFLILSRSLPASYKHLTRIFVILPILSIEEKIDVLVEYEIDLKNEEIKTEKIYIAKQLPSPKVSPSIFQI